MIKPIYTYVELGWQGKNENEYGIVKSFDKVKGKSIK